MRHTRARMWNEITSNGPIGSSRIHRYLELLILTDNSLWNCMRPLVLVSIELQVPPSPHIQQPDVGESSADQSAIGQQLKLCVFTRYINQAPLSAAEDSNALRTSVRCNTALQSQNVKHVVLLINKFRNETVNWYESNIQCAQILYVVFRSFYVVKFMTLRRWCVHDLISIFDWGPVRGKLKSLLGISPV